MGCWPLGLYGLGRPPPPVCTAAVCLCAFHPVLAWRCFPPMALFVCVRHRPPPLLAGASQEAGRLGRDALLREYLPELLPALGRGCLHPLIRLSYSLHEVWAHSPLRLWSVGRGQRQPVPVIRRQSSRRLFSGSSPIVFRTQYRLIYWCQLASFPSLL